MRKQIVCCLVIVATLLISSFCTRVLPEHPKASNVPPAPAASPAPTSDPPAEAQEDKKLLFDRPSSRPTQTRIKVFKKDRLLELHADGRLIGRFEIALGSAPVGDKDKEGDRKTPEGTYYICTRNDRSRFTLFLGLSYPDTEDAQRALDKGMISRAVFNRIKSQIDAKKQPPWDTPLGGAVGIHGGGASSDWTFGCIAMSNEDIRIIWEYAPLLTPVEILP